MAAEDDVRLVTVATFPARYLAELPIQSLQGAGIPVVVKGEEAGIWGPAFAGPTSRGVEIQVPRAAEEDAREILEGLGVVDDPEGGPDDDEAA